MRIVAIHQPPYLPWLGLLAKIAQSHVFVVLDTVQYNKRSFQNRTLYSCDGGPRYLSLAVKCKGHQQTGLPINEVELVDRRRPAKHWETLRHRYGKRPGWPRLAEALEEILRRPRQRLIDLNLATLRLTIASFGLEVDIRVASQLGAEGQNTDLMLHLTQRAGGDVYLSGTGAKAYMDDQRFYDAGIDVRYASFEHPLYSQSHGGPFQPGCFALEWFLEEPDSAAQKFQAYITQIKNTERDGTKSATI